MIPTKSDTPNNCLENGHHHTYMVRITKMFFQFNYMTAIVHYRATAETMNGTLQRGNINLINTFN